MSTPHDFDFLHGEWDIINRRLLNYLDPDSGWEEFPATHWCRSLHDGAANIDEMSCPTKGFKGVTLRLFDRETEDWHLYWSPSQTGTLFPPVIGRFGADRRGEFQGDDTYRGEDVRVRYLWSVLSQTAAHWEMAFSPDGGQTWVRNWTMDFTRRPAS
ncbi:hypothetical protein [Streptomyces sp. NL15-2K]|uniref:hypothetical protein n=1 Tax=Streptomyces sp. NL15-2K TaxID=376149 RepID=UPI000F571009|nr:MULTISPECIES: hypothetical protein [Actinomycetes]WKX14447.1 hypothetical protein Q4V64_45845 [Kutzneria buriramensis]GCB44480.1 hypothetical protein SNL152K_1770 [Streptomyces sp. NL15-2K]